MGAVLFWGPLFVASTMNMFVCPPSKTLLYSLRVSYDSSPGGTSSEEPVIPCPSSSLRMLAPATVNPVATRITSNVALIGNSPTFSHNLSNALNCPLLYRSSCTSAGTISIERTNVVEMPSNRVVPTVRIGSIGTRLGHLSTLKPMMVVSADRNIAWPVVSTARTVAVRLM